MWLHSSQSPSFNLHRPQLHLQQSLLLSQWTSPCRMQNMSSRVKAMCLLLVRETVPPPTCSGQKGMELPVWSTVSPSQCSLLQKAVKQALRVDLMGLRRERRHRWLPLTTQRGTVKASAWVPDQQGLGAALLSVLDRYASKYMCFWIVGFPLYLSVHFLFLFISIKGYITSNFIFGSLHRDVRPLGYFLIRLK